MGLLDRIFPSSKRFESMSSPTSFTMDWDWDDPSDSLMQPLDRRAAMGIPGVARAHHTIVSKIAQFELVADNGSGVENTNQPTFLYRTNLGEPPEFRMWETADDLFFYGRSLWVVDRGALGQVLGARWLPIDRWTVDTDRGVVQIDGADANPSTYLFFNIPLWGGILEEGHRTLRGALDMERAWTARMSSPASIVELKITDDRDLSQAEIDNYVRAWQRKHRAGAPAVGMTPPGMELVTHQNSLGSSDLFLQARDQGRTDIGSHVSLDGGMVDSAGGTSSLTYETNEGQRADFYEFDLPFWAIPLTARLSLDDVVPAGTRVFVRFRPIVAPDQSALVATQKEISESTSVSETAPQKQVGPTTGTETTTTGGSDG